MAIKDWSNDFFHNFKDTKIILLALAILMLVVLITCTVALIVISYYKNKKLQILKNLEYYQNVSLQERFKRINIIIKNNSQYQNIFNIWINRYKTLLKHDCQSIIKSFLEILNLERKKEYKNRNRLIKDTYRRSNNTKAEIKKLLLEVDYFISIDQLMREYQLSFQQNFNFLQTEIIKSNLQNAANHDQLNQILEVLELKFKELDDAIEQAHNHYILIIFNQIALGIKTLAELIINLPNLNHQLNHLIPAKIATITTQLQNHLQETNYSIVFQDLAQSVTNKMTNAKNLINNLQYKKATNQIKEILQLLNKFHHDFQVEENFTKLFWQNYHQFETINLNLNQIFDFINHDLENFNKLDPDNFHNEEISDLKNIINQQLLTLNSIESHLILEIGKPEKTVTYQQLLMLFYDLLENNIFVFNSLVSYNELLIKKIKPKLIIDHAVDKLNSMMLQIENILTNLQYFYLQIKYLDEFTLLQKNLQEMTEIIANAKKSNYDLIISQLKELQSRVFHLYQLIKITNSFYYLANDTLVFANRLRKDDPQLNFQFQTIEDQISKQDYHQAVIKLLSLMQ